MGFWDKLRGGGRSTEGEALYAAVVDRARDPDWYVAGGVPDTIDGRFGMVATVLALVLLRLEDDADAAGAVARLTEHFVTDMDGQLRQIGVGDVVVGKHMGKMMQLLGGRLGAYRHGLAGGDLRPALVRNLYAGTAPDPAALEHVAARFADLARALAATPRDQLLAGRLP